MQGKLDENNFKNSSLSLHTTVAGMAELGQIH
jgi:hypothetical protein